MAIAIRNSKGEFRMANGSPLKPGDRKKVEGFPIPPAYTDVQVHLDPKDKILYTARDKAGKMQYFYKPFWHEKRDRRKFCRLIDFGRQMPEILKTIEGELKKKEWSREKLVALQLKIITMCNFRIGNLIDGENTKSTGISTLKKKHLAYKKTCGTIKFVGKSGVDNECKIDDSHVLELLRDLSSNASANDYLFVNSEGKRVDSSAVNAFLKQFGDFTSKDFRTWVANSTFVELALAQGDPGETQAARKKGLRDLVVATAEQLYHTPAICKKKYILPQLQEAYMKNPGALLRRLRKGGLVGFLEEVCGKNK